MHDDTHNGKPDRTHHDTHNGKPDKTHQNAQTEARRDAQRNTYQIA